MYSTYMQLLTCKKPKIWVLWTHYPILLGLFLFLCHFIHFEAVGHFAWFVYLFYVILYILGQLDILLGVSLVFLCNFVHFGAVGHWLGVSLFLCYFVHFGAVGHFAGLVHLIIWSSNITCVRELSSRHSFLPLAPLSG